jgi:adenylate cyclase
VAATRRLAAVMFTDTVDYTASTQTDEARALELLHSQKELIRPLLTAHHGREIKSTGDGFLVEFGSALKATQCAIAIQRQIHERNAQPGITPIRIRIGIHLGDVEERGADILGDAVNIAARVEPVAEAGGICLSGAVREQVWNKIPEKLEKLPSTPLKGLQAPTDIYRVLLPWTTWERPPASAGSSGLAVIPFANISPDPKDEYFADGLTEELITVLSHLRGLRVIARTSVMQYKSAPKPASQIGAELGVSWILEGSVRKAGNRLRIAAQLIDASSQGHAWASTYDRELDDVFAIQAEIAERVASSLKVQLLDADRHRLEKGRERSVEAYTLLLKGRYNLQRADKNSLEAAIEYFEEAIAQDPSYAAAYAGLSYTYSILGYLDIVDPSEAHPKAEKHARTALELDEGLAEAHVSLAVTFWAKYDFESREKELKRALELNPNLAQAHLLLADGWRLTGRWDDALKEVEKAVELDPRSVETAGDAGSSYLYCNQYDQAIQHLTDALEMDPRHALYLTNLGLAHIQKGSIEEGLAEVKRAAEMSSSPSFRDLAYAYVKAGLPEEARKLLASLLQSSSGNLSHSVSIGGVYAVLGEREKALDWLEKAYAERSGYLPSVATDFVFDNLRDEPRFHSLLKKMNLA